MDQSFPKKAAGQTASLHLNTRFSPGSSNLLNFWGFQKQAG
jgi:hypothetical protein